MGEGGAPGDGRWGLCLRKARVGEGSAFTSTCEKDGRFGRCWICLMSALGSWVLVKGI